PGTSACRVRRPHLGPGPLPRTRARGARARPRSLPGSAASRDGSLLPPRLTEKPGIRMWVDLPPEKLGPHARHEIRRGVSWHRLRGQGFERPSLSAMKTSLYGNFSNRAAGLPKLVASTSGG